MTARIALAVAGLCAVSAGVLAAALAYAGVAL